MLARLVRAAALPWPSLLACPLLHAATALLNLSRGSELSYMTLAFQREPTAYRSLLTRLGAVLADAESMLARLVRGCIALAFTACVLAVASSHCHADTVKGGELSYMTLALQRETTAYRSLLTRARAVLADPEPMLARLVCGCIALAFTACVLAVACSHGLADAVKGGQLSYMTLALQRE